MLASGAIDEVQACAREPERGKGGQNRADAMPRDTSRAFWASLIRASDRTVRFEISMSVVMAITAGITAALAPLLLKAFFDQIGSGTPFARALPLVAAYLVVVFAIRLLSQVQNYLFTTGEQRLQQRLSANTFQHLLALPMNFHLQKPLGAILRAHSMMLQGVRLMMVHTIHTLLPISAQLAAIVLVVASLFSSATWVCLAGIAIAYTSVFAVAARWQARATSRALVADTRAGTCLTDGLINIEPIKSAVAERSIGADYDRSLGEGFQHWREASIRRTITGAAIAVLYVTSAATLILIATSGSDNDAVSVGGLVLLFTYLAQIFAPLESAGYAFQDIAQVMRQFDDWRPIAGLQGEDMGSGGAFPSNRGAPGPPVITFEDVVLTYQNGTQALSRLSFSALSGQVTAIVGPSGAGKTSIVRALVRHHDVTSGAIRIDGVSISDIALHDLRSHVAIVSQDTVLLHASFRKNITFPQTVCSPDRIDDVLRVLCLDKLVARLPQGLETTVGERGQQLSGGERQRVAIARALLRDAPILVLDEPTSALDSETEEAIRAALFNSPQRRTSILITHRLELAARADKIIVVSNGTVEQEGTHAQLLARGGAYAGLWRDHQVGAPVRTDKHEVV